MIENSDRKEVAEKFKGQLPDYLTDYFDEKELKEIRKKYYDDIRAKARETSKDDRLKYRQGVEEEFWKNNKVRLIKRELVNKGQKGVKPAEIHPPRNEERVEQERELTKDEIRALIHLCSKNIQQFKKDRI